MPRNRIRKTNKGSFTQEVMQEAINLVRSGMKVRAAARQKGINYQTLSRYLKKIANVPGCRLTPNYDNRKVFSADQEKILVDYVLDRSKLGYGMTAVEVRKLAWELGKANNVSYPKSWDTNSIAGEDWFSAFMKRNQHVSIRKPEQCSIARGMAFNKVNIANFFSKLEVALSRHPSFGNGSRVYNLDETATSTVGNVSQRIISPRGIKQVHQIKSQERGVTVTTCCIIGAHGVVLPPAMIFPRVKFTKDMLIGAYPGTLGLATKSGWMTTEMFVEVLKHFIKCTSSSKENPSLLILDSVISHLSLEAIELCKNNGVTLFTLPPHTTHRTQPLDVGVYGPFKGAYNKAYHDWSVSHPAEVCTIRHVASLVNIAVSQSCTPKNIISAFQATGIHPFNSQIFGDGDFSLSKVTEKPASDSTADAPSTSDDENIDNPAEILFDMVLPQDSQDTSSNHIESVDISEKEETEDLETGKEDNATGKQKNFITPAMLKGYPEAQVKLGKKNSRRKGKCMIVTDTPEKTEIQERVEKRKREAEKKEERKLKKIKKTAEKKKATKNKGGTKRQLHFQVDSEDENADFLSSDYEQDEAEKLSQVPTKSTALVANPKKFVALPYPPTEGDHVLIDFKGKENKYFIGKVIKDVDEDGDIEVSYYRVSEKQKGKFVLPNVPDLKSVSLANVKMLLPKPTCSSGTARQKNFLIFDVDFSLVKLG